MIRGSLLARILSGSRVWVSAFRPLALVLALRGHPVSVGRGSPRAKKRSHVDSEVDTAQPSDFYFPALTGAMSEAGR
jgi:hypothetical protein